MRYLDAKAVAAPGPVAAVRAITEALPVFDSALLRGYAVVVAVGSHEPDARELDAPLLGRATVVVEDVAAALREAGDRQGVLTPADLRPMRDVVTGAVTVPVDRPSGLQERWDVVAGPRRRRSGLSWVHRVGQMRHPRRRLRTDRR